MTVRVPIDHALDVANLVESPEKLDCASFRTLARTRLVFPLSRCALERSGMFPELIPPNAAIRTCYNPCDSALRVEDKYGWF
jgi:hypothetical protein